MVIVPALIIPECHGRARHDTRIPTFSCGLWLLGRRLFCRTCSSRPEFGYQQTSGCVGEVTEMAVCVALRVGASKSRRISQMIPFRATHRIRSHAQVLFLNVYPQNHAQIFEKNNASTDSFAHPHLLFRFPPPLRPQVGPPDPSTHVWTSFHCQKVSGPLRHLW